MNGSRPDSSRRSERRVWLLIAVLVPVVVLASVGFVVSLGIAFNWTGKQEALNGEERELVLDITHVSAFMDGYRPDLSREALTKKRFIDASYEIDYVYDVDDDEQAPYLNYSLTFEGNEDDAMTTYASYWGGTKVAFYVFGETEVVIDETNALFRWGDESRFGVLMTDGQPFGNVFLARRGPKVVYFLLSGLYFDDAQAVTELLTPYLAKLDAYTELPTVDSP